MGDHYLKICCCWEKDKQKSNVSKANKLKVHTCTDRQIDSEVTHLLMFVSEPE